MIPFDTFTLAAVAAELRKTVLGAKVQKVQQPSAGDMVLSVYGPGGAHRLLLSADPQTFRVHLTQVRRENPVTPPGFCQISRKLLEGARLDAITLPRFDRALHLLFHAHDGERVTLIAELMGRNANLVLAGGGHVVRGVIRPVPASGERPLRPGQPYADPPGFHDRQDLLALSGAEIESLASAAPTDDPKAARSWLMATFSGIGGFAADEILARAERAGGVGPALASLMEEVRAGRFAPHSVSDAEGHTDGIWAFAPLTVPPDRRFPRDSVSVALDTFYATFASRTAEVSEKTLLGKAIGREVAFRERETTSARATLAEAGRAGQYEKLGNLLLAHLPAVPRGAAEVALPDLYTEDGAQIAVPLDPKRSPQENAESYFDRARKTRDAAEYAEGRLEDLTRELRQLANLAKALERAESAEDFARIRRDLTALVGAKRVGTAKGTSQQRPPQKPKENRFGGHRIHTCTVEGYELLIGGNAEANDYLTTRIAAPADWWFHVRASAGAHGVLRTNGRPKAVPDTILRRAAEIVAARSGSAVKHSRFVAVDIVEKRYVRKPRGAKPGLVTISGGRTLDVTPRL